MSLAPMRPEDIEPHIPHVVCLLDTLDDIGGAETLALDLLVRLDPERYRRSLFVTRWTDRSETVDPGKASVARMRAAGVEVRGIERSSRWDLSPWRSFLRFLREEDVDLIHAHKFGSNAWAVLMARLARRPAVIAHEHMWSYSESGALHRFIDRVWIARGADCAHRRVRGGSPADDRGGGDPPATRHAGQERRCAPRRSCRASPGARGAGTRRGCDRDRNGGEPSARESARGPDRGRRATQPGTAPGCA